MKGFLLRVLPTAGAGAPHSSPRTGTVGTEGCVCRSPEGPTVVGVQGLSLCVLVEVATGLEPALEGAWELALSQRWRPPWVSQVRCGPILQPASPRLSGASPQSSRLHERQGPARPLVTSNVPQEPPSTSPQPLSESRRPWMAPSLPPTPTLANPNPQGAQRQPCRVGAGRGRTAQGCPPPPGLALAPQDSQADGS